jgi:hypothetical protein
MKKYEEETGRRSGSLWVAQETGNKADWAGVCPGDAFKPELDYHLRLSAQRIFYKASRKVQEAAARHAGIIEGSGFKPKVNPQIGACYSGYPASVAAYAAMGLTAYLEFESRSARNLFRSQIVEAIKERLFREATPEGSTALDSIIVLVSEWVQKRLFLEDLSSDKALGAIEIYRVWAAAHQSMRFETLGEMVRCVVLFGDLLPPWEHIDLHPLSKRILKGLSEDSRIYFEKLFASTPDRYYDIGKDWIADLCRVLLPYLPDEVFNPDAAMDSQYRSTDRLRFPSSEDEAPDGDQMVPPLDSPRRPSLFKRPSLSRDLIRAATDNLSRQDQKYELLTAALGIESHLKDLARRLNLLEEMLARSWEQKNDWEDMRSDVLVRILSDTPFMKDPIEGDPACGHLVDVRVGDRETYQGTIFDRPISPSEDPRLYEDLMMDSKACTRVMKDIIYPNRESRPVVERLRAKGSIDPTRLALSDFSPAIFKVHRLEERLDRRGSPVVAIACDGSGSLEADQMHTLKILTASWLNSTAGTDVRVLAGVYTSGRIRHGLVGPVVNWIYHPHKTPAITTGEAVRTVAALPFSGDGVQSDALSIAFIVEEAKRLAKGRMIYLILLTDCAWNRSFNTEKPGYSEVRSLFEALYAELGEMLHVTMVRLGSSDPTGMEDLIDKVITIPQSDLKESEAIAKTVGVYVATCVRERNCS